MEFMLRHLCLLLFCFHLTSGAAAVDFVREVRPVFERHCYECHSEKKRKSGFRLDIKSEALRGGDNHGPDILPGNAKDSPLIHFLITQDEDELMPPKGRLSVEEIALITRWVEEGAVWPDGVDTATLEDKSDHWSFKPLAVPSVPRGAAEVNPIDALVDVKLAEMGLSRSPPAEPLAWLRRVTLDLTGLPPTPLEVEAFLSDGSAGFEAVVERLLDSPRYGERWAQHWLDVVRYADTHGFEVNTERPNAWPYRDYVIRAFQEDRPYDGFIREQMVGDAWGEDAATGFLVTASVLLPGQIGKDEPSKRLARQDSLDEIVVNLGQTFLGLSLGCARCHDHKFDPVSAREYYAMQSFIAGVEYGERELRTPEAEAARREAEVLKTRLADLERQLARFVPLARSGATRPRVTARENVDRFAPVRARRLRFTILATNKLEPCVDELEVFNAAGENVALASAGAVVRSSGDIIVADRHDLKFLNDGEYGNARSWMSNEKGGGWVEVEFASEQVLERVVWGRDRLGKFTDRLATKYRIEVAAEEGAWQMVADAEDRALFDAESQKAPAFNTKGLSAAEAEVALRLMEERKPLEAKIQAVANVQKVFAGNFRAPDDIHLLNRGDPEQPLERVAPAVPAVLGAVRLSPEAGEQERRRVLAEWIADAENPLTARVMVNRIWQGHFGTGLVETASDFGRSGMKPTHPELLDWLAAEFIRSGWSVKHMHRLITLSQTYRQSSKITSPAAAQVDAEARYLWRFPARRLEAEAIRDGMLAVSGALNFEMYGRGFDLFDKRGGLSGFQPVEAFTRVNQRRMIYAHKVRRETEAVFGAFDCPDAGQSTARRLESTTPIQALNLLNSRFTLQHAAVFAHRVEKEAGADLAAQVRRAWLLALSRVPVEDELADAVAVVREHGLAVLCRALFNCNEFLFLP